MMKINLSKEISYALRHAPSEYGLKLDAEGFVAIDDLLSGLKQRSEWTSLTKDDIVEVVTTATKKRHEIVGNDIRAFYGHSTHDKITKVATKPPKVLYHGTTVDKLIAIDNEGLMPMNRQYVHLSTNPQTAKKVAERWGKAIVILTVHSEQAYEQGYSFYVGNDDVWLCDYVLPDFIKLLDEEMELEMDDDEFNFL